MRKIRVALLAVICGAGFTAATAVPAQAHYGDWWTQHNITAHETVTRCNANWGGWCPDSWYVGSGPYGDHSRWFEFGRTATGARICYDVYYIGHTYTIFSESHTCRTALTSKRR